MRRSEDTVRSWFSPSTLPVLEWMELRLPSLPACAFTPWAISLTFLSLFDKGGDGVSLEVTSDKVKTGTTWWQEEPIYSTSGVSGEIPKLWVYTSGGGVKVSCVGSWGEASTRPWAKGFLSLLMSLYFVLCFFFFLLHFDLRWSP